MTYFVKVDIGKSQYLIGQVVVKRMKRAKIIIFRPTFKKVVSLKICFPTMYGMIFLEKVNFDPRRHLFGQVVEMTENSQNIFGPSFLRESCTALKFLFQRCIMVNHQIIFKREDAVAGAMQPTVMKKKLISLNFHGCILNHIIYYSTMFFKQKSF